MTNALNVYTLADQLLNNIQSTHLELESKLFWRENNRRLYENAIEACYLLGKIENAFYFFERSRSAILNAQLNEQRWLKEADILKQSQLNKEIYLNESELNKLGNSSSRYEDLQKAIIEKKQMLEQLQQQLKTSNPRYYQNFIDTTVVRISDVKSKILMDHDALIELFAGDSAAYVMILFKAGIENSKIQ